MTRRRELLKRVIAEPTEEWDVEWNASSGLLPEQTGFTKVVSGSVSISQGDDNLNIIVNATQSYVRYSPSDYLTTNSGELEFDICINSMELTSTGVRPQISNGTSGGQFYIQKNHKYEDFVNGYFNNSSSLSVSPFMNIGERHKVKLRFAGNIQSVFVDGEYVAETTNLNGSYNTETRLFFQSAMNVDLYSIKYREVD